MTCGCKPIESRVFAPVVAREEFIGIKFCPFHSGEMTEKLAEALRFAHGTHRFSYQEEACGICQLLAAYDELQGRKG